MNRIPLFETPRRRRRKPAASAGVELTLQLPQVRAPVRAPEAEPSPPTEDSESSPRGYAVVDFFI